LPGFIVTSLSGLGALEAALPGSGNWAVAMAGAPSPAIKHPIRIAFPLARIASSLPQTLHRHRTTPGCN
jgi:hypothetical protein